MTRWLWPLSIIWAELMLSAFVFQRRLPEALQRDPSTLLVTLLWAGPVVSSLVLAQARRMDRAPERRSDVGNTLVLWLLAFCFSAHALLLAVMTGALAALQPALGLAVGGLCLGWGLLMPRLPFGSPFGLVHAASLHSEAAWRVRHRRLGRGLLLSGVLSFGCLWAPRTPYLIIALAPVLFTGVLALRPERTSE